jgi:hypothetical protein
VLPTEGELAELRNQLAGAEALQRKYESEGNQIGSVFQGKEVADLRNRVAVLEGEAEAAKANPPADRVPEIPGLPNAEGTHTPAPTPEPASPAAAQEAGTNITKSEASPSAPSIPQHIPGLDGIITRHQSDGTVRHEVLPLNKAKAQLRIEEMLLRKLADCVGAA